MKFDYNVNIKFSKYIDLSYYDEIIDFKDGLIIVKKENKYGLLDKEGNVIVDVIYDSISFNDMKDESTSSYISEYNKLILVKKDNKYGYMDNCGNIKIPIIFDKAFFFESVFHDLTKVCINEKWGIIDSSGNYVINPEYRFIVMHPKSDLFIACKDNHLGVLNKYGDTVLKFKYEYINFLWPNIVVRKRNKYYIYDEKGEVIAKCNYNPCIKEKNGGFLTYEIIDEQSISYPDRYKKVITDSGCGLNKTKNKDWQEDKVIIPAYLNDFLYSEEMIIENKKLFNIHHGYKFELVINIDDNSIIKEFNDEKTMLNYISMVKKEVDKNKKKISKEVEDFEMRQVDELAYFIESKMKDASTNTINYIDSLDKNKKSGLSLT